MKLDLKHDLKRIGQGLLYLGVIYAVILVFDLGVWGTWSFLTVLSAGMMLFKKQFSVKKLLKNSAILLVFIFGLRYLMGHGIIGFAGLILIIVCWILFMKWDQYIIAKRRIEGLIWGEPIHKFVERGERLPRLRIRF